MLLGGRLVTQPAARPSPRIAVRWRIRTSQTAWCPREGVTFKGVADPGLPGRGRLVRPYGMNETVAFLGLGKMGQGMAGRLAQAGYRLRVWNRTPGKEDPAWK